MPERRKTRKRKLKHPRTRAVIDADIAWHERVMDGLRKRLHRIDYLLSRARENNLPLSPTHTKAQGESMTALHWVQSELTRLRTEIATDDMVVRVVPPVHAGGCGYRNGVNKR